MRRPQPTPRRWPQPGHRGFLPRELRRLRRRQRREPPGRARGVAPLGPAPGAPRAHDDDAQLAAALQASLRETTPARPAMSEDEQLAAALQASLQAPVVTPPSSYAPASSLAGATLESTLAAFGLERLVPVLAQEDIRDVETLALLEAEDLQTMNIPVAHGAHSSRASSRRGPEHMGGADSTIRQPRARVHVKRQPCPGAALDRQYAHQIQLTNRRPRSAPKKRRRPRSVSALSRVIVLAAVPTPTRVRALAKVRATIQTARAPTTSDDSSWPIPDRREGTPACRLDRAPFFIELAPVPRRVPERPRYVRLAARPLPDWETRLRLVWATTVAALVDEFDGERSGHIPQVGRSRTCTTGGWSGARRTRRLSILSQLA